MICSSTRVGGIGEGVRGRPFNIGSSSLRLELSPSAAVVNKEGESVVTGLRFSSFNDEPSIDGLSKLTDEERDKVAG
jgi:hypothetical protein